MKSDIRTAAAKFYDLNPHAPRDVPFYLARIPSPDAAVLELGCGTGRVTVPLAAHCGLIRGIDRSGAMLALCRDKLRAAGISADRAAVSKADITDFDLGRRFDLVIAPFRVLQNLETDAQVDGLLDGIRRHLAPGGTAILNAFRPNLPPDEMRARWVTPGEKPAWEVPVEGGRVTCHDRRLRMDPDRLVLYPELVYRRYEGEKLVEEAELHIAMRCWYPDEFTALITGHGFDIVARWGGYEEEAYGEGPELVLAFRG
jgi:SAM-dependent methyltransferase